jgi:hypothetical protein
MRFYDFQIFDKKGSCTGAIRAWMTTEILIPAA